LIDTIKSVKLKMTKKDKAPLLCLVQCVSR